MNVLFISSGNKKTSISPITLNQGESLKTIGIEVTYFGIKGKGLLGYIKNVFILRRYLSNKHFDVYHAHYSDSALVATLAGVKPLLVSLMGSDIQANIFKKLVLKFFNHFCWKRLIVKSAEMKNIIKLDEANVIPNGVDINRFKPIDKKLCQDRLGWSNNSIHILFGADPDRFEKNYALAKEAFGLLNEMHFEIHFLKNINNEEIPYYLNASDIVVLTSLWEGSPNVIKEAMACNKNIISTNVGDVKWLLGENNGGIIISHDSIQLADQIKFVLNNNIQNNLRNRIIELKLDSQSVANKLSELYQTCIN